MGCSEEGNGVYPKGEVGCVGEVWDVGQEGLGYKGSWRCRGDKDGV